MAALMQKQPHYTGRWGDLLDDDDDLDLGVLLPPPVVVGPDAKGIKTVIEYRIDDEGNKVKVTTTKQVRTVRRSKNAIERRSWSKFGDAAKEAAGSRLTMVSTEEILLDRTGASGRLRFILLYIFFFHLMNLHCSHIYVQSIWVRIIGVVSFDS
jgi:translation initiation factor 3 subunit G